jgi:hypothetical protein
MPKGHAVMRASSRPALSISSLSPFDVDLTRPGKALFVCPDCGKWLSPRRGLAPAHNNAADSTRCPGSARLVQFDLHPKEWRAALSEARRQRERRAKSTIKNLIAPSTRRATVVHTIAYPPVTPAVCQIAARRGHAVSTTA